MSNTMTIIWQIYSLLKCQRY